MRRTQSGRGSNGWIRGSATASALLGLAALAVLLCLACSGGKQGAAGSGSGETPARDIKGSGLVEGGSIVITNKDSFDWKNVKIEVTAGSKGTVYRCDLPSVGAMSYVTLEGSRFADSKDLSLNPAADKPTKLVIRCDTPDGPGFCEGEWE